MEGGPSRRTAPLHPLVSGWSMTNMKMRPGEKKPEQPGVNGIRYAARSGYLYYTSTSQQLMMRVPVNQETLEPAGLPGVRGWGPVLG